MAEAHHDAGYEQGYGDGESSAYADWELTKILALDRVSEH
jgi:hypothetical protein